VYFLACSLRMSDTLSIELYSLSMQKGRVAILSIIVWCASATYIAGSSYRKAIYTVKNFRLL